MHKHFGISWLFRLHTFQNQLVVNGFYVLIFGEHDYSHICTSYMWNELIVINRIMFLHYKHEFHQNQIVMASVSVHWRQIFLIWQNKTCGLSFSFQVQVFLLQSLHFERIFFSLKFCEEKIYFCNEVSLIKLFH